MALARMFVEIDGVIEKFSEENLQRGRYAMGNQMMSDMDQFVPRREGHLRTAASMNSDATMIEYHMNYASKQFYTHHKNYTTPGTGARWDLKAKAMYASQWKTTFTRGANF